jgi:hypothetical protein
MSVIRRVGQNPGRNSKQIGPAQMNSSKMCRNYLFLDKESVKFREVTKTCIVQC